jgi:hypothetical protein
VGVVAGMLEIGTSSESVNAAKQAGSRRQGCEMQRKQEASRKGQFKVSRGALMARCRVWWVVLGWGRAAHSVLVFCAL